MLPRELGWLEKLPSLHENANRWHENFWNFVFFGFGFEIPSRFSLKDFEAG